MVSGSFFGGSGSFCSSSGLSSLGFCSFFGGLLGSSFADGSLLLLADDHGGTHFLLDQTAALEQGLNDLGGLGALGETGTDGLGVETGLLGAGVVEAQLLEGTTVAA